MGSKTIGLYYCNGCKSIDKYIVTQQTTVANCRDCERQVKVYECVFFAQALMDKFMTNARELQAFKNQELEESGNEIDNDNDENEHNPLINVKLSQTDILASKEQHQMLFDWFSANKIQPTFDYSTVDMSGYYDDASAIIGQNYKVFKDITKKIIWSYKKNHTGLNIDLSKHSQKEIQVITNALRTFYSHSLFTKYNYSKKDKNVHIKLQKAMPVKQFFMGIWLEWFALNDLLIFAKEQGENYNFSCARSVNIKFANEDVHELDLVFMKDKQQPLVIECKTGEFRDDINKFLSIQKRLKIPAKNYVILATDLTTTQAKSLTSMYGLTFLSIDGFSEFIKEYY